MTSRIASMRATVFPTLQKVHELMQEGKNAEALQQLLKVRTEAAMADVTSAWVLYSMAIACDYLGNLDEALAFISEALSFDPISLPVVHSFNVILGKVRAALAAPGRIPDDPTTPRLYAGLVAVAEADATSCLVMAKYLLATDEAGDALALANAVAVIAPSAEAWDLVAKAAKVVGDSETAMEATLKAAAYAKSSKAPAVVWPPITPVAQA